MANEMNPTECMGKKKGKSVRFNYDQKECRASRTLENYPLQLFGRMQILSMQLQTLWTSLQSPLLHVALAKLKTVTIQATLKRSILTRRMTLWTERSETYSMDKGVRALGDDSGQLNSWIQCHSDSAVQWYPKLSYCVPCNHEPENRHRSSSPFKWLIAGNMEVLVAVLDAISNFLVGQWSSVIFRGLNVFLAPTTWGKTPKSSTLS